MPRQATERDFRKPEFLDADPSDYEIRDHDLKVVRKDRWEVCVRRIAILMQLTPGEWEVDDVVKAVAHLAKKEGRDDD